MNIGLDIDYTITEMPEFFSILAEAMRKNGHRVYAVSYRDASDLLNTTKLLDELGIENDGIYLCDTKETISQFKTRMAIELDLDMFFDDMPEALCNMPKKVKRVWFCDPSVYDLNRVVECLTGILRF